MSAEQEGSAGSTLRTAPGERFEWLQTEPERPQAKAVPEREGARAEAGRRCRRCGWLDSLAEAECFRCGEPYPPLDELGCEDGQPHDLRFTGLPDPEGPSVHVVAEPASELLGKKPASPEDWQLRQRSAELSLLPGFDELLSLGEVNPETFRSYAHQQAVARKVLRELGGAALMADETGLGKTIEAGLVAKELLLRGLARQILVVVPASLALQWKEEMLEKFRLDFVLVKDATDLKDDPPLALVSYATLRGEGAGKLVRERSWDLLICDEAHHLKNRATKQHRAVARVRKKYVLLLSATPFHNKLLELKNLLDILKPGLLGSTRAFNKQYVDEKDPRKPRNLHHLQALLSEVMIRNRRSEVAVKLPPRRAAVYHIDLSEEEQELYDDLSGFVSGEVKTRLLPGKPGESRPMTLILALINLQREVCSSPYAVAKGLLGMATNHELPLDVDETLRELAGRANGATRWRKAEAVEEVLEQLEGKLVVFCEYRATIAALVKRLRQAGIETVPFHGGLNRDEKAQALANFKESARVLVASRAGAEGLNIQFCSNVLNFDLPWNPMIVEQRIGRVHRLGQQNPVTVVNLSVKGTIEARILELLTNKLQLFTAVLGEVDLILGSLHSERGFEELLREAWLKGVVDGNLGEALDRFGESLAQARQEYDSIKEAEVVLDDIAPAGVDSGEAGDGAAVAASEGAAS